MDTKLVVGYGVPINNNLNEKGLKIFEDAIELFYPEGLDFNFKWLQYQQIGNTYIDDHSEFWFVFEDPLGRPEAFETFKEKLKDMDIFINPEPRWIKRLFVY